MVGAYNGDPALKQGDLHGLDFSLRGPLFLIGEVGIRWNYGRDSTGLSGNLKFGGYYNGGTHQTFATTPNRQSEKESGLYGLYILGDQVLLRWGDPGQDRHLGAFGALTAAPDQRVNKVPYFFDTGIVAYGPLHKRSKDFVGFAIVYGSFSRDLRREEVIQPTSIGPQHFEMALELNYGWTVRPGLLVQPDVQYLVHPNGSQRLPNSVAFGLNIVVSL
jgi:porin